MNNKHYSSAYKKTSILTASKSEILIMLYEGAIHNVKKASYCIEKGDIAGKGMAIVKAHDIINELSNTLNFDVGGKIAEDLEQLYNFMTDELIKGNMNNSVESLKSVEKLLTTLLDGWKGAVRKGSQNENTQADKK